MATVFTTDGTVAEIEDANFQKIKELIDGHVTVAPIGNGEYLAMDEDGLMKGLPANKMATEFHGNQFGLLVGTVIICSEKELN
jgi:hypothetical protein